ncbi:MAG: FkbM family methyltransferase [Arenicella sp.]|jgi:FkbM family methyltransferase
MTPIITKLKLLLKIIIKKEFYVKPDVDLKSERFGSDYGGWHLVTKYINQHSIVYSFGVGEDATFDTALIDRFNLTVHAFDPTPKSINWVKNQDFPTNFIMHEYGIANFEGTVSFNPPTNPNHISHTLLERKSTEKDSIIVNVKTLRSAMSELKHTKIDVLKLDIEGAEYEVITDLINSNIRPKQILVEFHHRFNNVGISKSKTAIKQLRSIGYRLYSISSSNEEFCFLATPDE